ncbi:hypothetical protein ABIF65_002566 [Bradyrhizobium japonicum]|uniref:hypothetical protein n=1 Tax=Bradyrhizobium TaxID=374 RepID=UPI000429DF70|nr:MULTISPECIES: hypothetical protein [Bradyrhizobium]MBR0884796.1 hypothetical protein [Bradyrhizobium liaoningense]MBR1004854.1 hypothetical protein [Bradyrhizobium liaoningense]MBR1071360.1 hypothetical protein [Bradyrhizobium liaoningense]MCP1742274.1 hypothetical protein [Bradyrhizobium japonicum]MCP1780638.1 hypothetical protein [Bradyrhizobium japonicum]
MQITLTLTKGMLDRLDQLRDRSINTATAKALTFTAKDAQQALRVQIPGIFVLRRPWVSAPFYAPMQLSAGMG